MSSSMGFAELIILIELAVLAAMPVAAEIGLRAGLRRRPASDEALSSQVSVVQASAFAILGLLAAFAISMAEARFSARRGLIRDEANAIQTTSLRAQYLPEPYRTELARLFPPYVDARIAYYEARDDLEAVERTIVAAEALQRAMWARAVAVVRESPEYGDTNAAFVESLGEMIALQRTRVSVIFDHVPLTITALLILVGLFACATTGYACGLAGRRVWLSVDCLPVLVGIAICVLLDLDSPRIGLITTGQAPMVRVQEAMAADAP